MERKSIVWAKINQRLLEAMDFLQLLEILSKIICTKTIYLARAREDIFCGNVSLGEVATCKET